MNCTRCQKRLSRKRARQIDGKLVCSACLFGNAPDPIREGVREAMGRIEPLPGDGPNRFTVALDGWHLSAPNRGSLCLMLWEWFAAERDRDGAEGGDAKAAPVPQDRQARACKASPVLCPPNPLNPKDTQHGG